MNSVLSLCLCTLILLPRGLFSCTAEFELAAEARIREDKLKASQELYCTCLSASCEFQISYQHTQSWSHTVEGSVGASFFSFVSASFSYSHEWGQSASAASSVTCTAQPGYKVWISIVPKMVRRLGWGRKKCFGRVTEEAWIDMKAPLKTKIGVLDAEVWCEVLQFHNCVANANATCHGTEKYKDTHDIYCHDNCAAGYCPPHMCVCD